MRKDNDNVVKGSGEADESNGKDAEVPMKVIPMPRPPHPFPQRLVKKTEDGKYRRFITILKQVSINVPFVEALEQMPGYEKFMNDLVTKNRSVTFEDDDRMQHCSVIAIRSLVQKNGKGPKIPLKYWKWYKITLHPPIVSKISFPPTYWVQNTLVIHLMVQN